MSLQPPRRLNKGAVLLGQKLIEFGARAELARELGVGPDRVSRWLNGQRVPTTLERRFLEDDYGISWRLWDDEVKGEVKGHPRTRYRAA
jgi:transcriptional regulator with XRE-family HTH domain